MITYVIIFCVVLIALSFGIGWSYGVESVSKHKNKIEFKERG